MFGVPKYSVNTSTLEEDHEARQESRHVMNMTPNDPRTEESTCKSSGTQQESSEAWIARIQALIMKETTSKAHMQVHTNKESREKQPGRNRVSRFSTAGSKFVSIVRRARMVSTGDNGIRLVRASGE
jgi:hypothetical protein